MNIFFECAEVLVIYIVLSMVIRYVFLKNPLPSKYQSIYHMGTIALALACVALFGVDVAVVAVVILSAVNLFLANQDSKLYEILLIIPMIGIVDGLLLPFLILPVRMLSFSQKAESAYVFCIYTCMFAGLVVFYFLGKSWRQQFAYELGDRDLQKWEEILLGIIGLILVVFSFVLNGSLNSLNGQESGEFKLILVLLGISSFVMTVSVIIVIYVGNKRAYFTSRVSDMQLNIITTMAEIVENRDKNTGGHIQRTATYVDIIVHELKDEGEFSDILTEQYMQDIKIAAPLHDIGKIHISDSILNKNGRLSDTEYTIMKTHSKVGRDLLIQAKENLGEFSYLDMAIDMAAYHHEWWDGSAKGYPEGLKGDAIPLSARIMAVADVFDALISKRVYKKAMPIDRAFGIIREETGSHFDPVVVNAFFRARTKIEDALVDFEEAEEEADDMWESVKTRAF